MERSLEPKERLGPHTRSRHAAWEAALLLTFSATYSDYSLRILLSVPNRFMNLVSQPFGVPMRARALPPSSLRRAFLRSAATFPSDRQRPCEAFCLSQAGRH